MNLDQLRATLDDRRGRYALDIGEALAWLDWCVEQIDGMAGTPEPPTRPGRYRLTVDVEVRHWSVDCPDELWWEYPRTQAGSIGRLVAGTHGLWSGPIEK